MYKISLELDKDGYNHNKQALSLTIMELLDEFYLSQSPELQITYKRNENI